MYAYNLKINLNSIKVFYQKNKSLNRKRLCKFFIFKKIVSKNNLKI